MSTIDELVKAHSKVPGDIFMERRGVTFRPFFMHDEIYFGLKADLPDTRAYQGAYPAHLDGWELTSSEPTKFRVPDDELVLDHARVAIANQYIGIECGPQFRQSGTLDRGEFKLYGEDGRVIWRDFNSRLGWHVQHLCDGRGLVEPGEKIILAVKPIAGSGEFYGRLNRDD